MSNFYVKNFTIIWAKNQDRSIKLKLINTKIYEPITKINLQAKKKKKLKKLKIIIYCVHKKSIIYIILLIFVSSLKL